MKAFPTGKTGDKNHDFYVSQDGMDLRDYFAAKALQGLLNEANSDFTDDAIAELSYSLADAMMKAREK